MDRCWEKEILKINVDEESFIYRRHIRSGKVASAEKRRFRFGDYMGDPEGAGQWTAWSAL